MALFSGTDILGVTQGANRYADWCWESRFGTNFGGGMVDETIRRPLPALTAIWPLSGTDVWLECSRTLIKQGIADLSTVIGCRDDIMVYLMHKELGS